MLIRIIHGIFKWIRSLWHRPKKVQSNLYRILNRRTSLKGCLSLVEREEAGVEIPRRYRVGSDTLLMIGSTYIFSPNKIIYPYLDRDIGIFLDQINTEYVKSAQIRPTHQITVMYTPRFRHDLSKAEIIFSEGYDLYGRYETGRFATLVLYKVAELLLYRHLRDIYWDMEIKLVIKQVLK